MKGQKTGQKSASRRLAKNKKTSTNGDSPAQASLAGSSIETSAPSLAEILPSNSDPNETASARSWLAAIVQSSDDAILSLDLNGNITSWNQAAERIYGYSPVEAIGRHVSLLIPEDRLDEEDVILQKIQKGEHTDHYETVRRRKDGATIYVSVSVSPIRGFDGSIVGAAKIARDITERTRTEERLDQNRLMLSLAMQSSKMGAWERDLASGVVWLSEELEQIFGLEKGSFAGNENAFYEVIYEDDRASVWAEIENAIKEHRSYNIEFRFNHADGTLRWMEGRGEAVYSQTGAPVRLYGVGIDVTDRKLQEQRYRFLSDLDRTLQATSEPEEAMSAASHLIGEYLQADRCIYCEVEDEETFVVLGDYTQNVPSVIGRWEIASFGNACVEAMLANQPFVVFDVDADSRIEPADLPPYHASMTRSLICVPLHKDGRLSAAMAVHHSSPRVWTEEEIEALQLAVNRCCESLERIKAIRKLENSDERFRLALSSGAVTVYEQDVDLGYKWVYPETPYRNDLLGKTDLELSPGPYGERLTQLKRRVISTGKKIREEVQAFVLDKEKWFDLLIEPRFGSDGRVIGVGGTALEITDRKLAEIELASAAERLNVAVTAADLGDWSWDATTDVVDFSERAAEIFGIPPGPHMTWTEMQSLIHEEDRDRARREVEIAVRDSGRYDIEYRVARPDGEEVWVAALGQTTYDANDEPLGMYGVVQDITARKRLQEEVFENEERFRGLMEQAPFSIQLFEPDGSTVRVNKAWEKLWGIKFENLSDYNVLQDPQLEIKGIAPLIRRAFEGEAVELPAILYDPDETLPDRSQHDDPKRWVSAVAYPLRDSHGRIRQVAIVHQDITERTRTRMLLDSQKEAMEMVLSGARLSEVLTYLTKTVEDQSGGKVAASILLLGPDGRLRNGASPSLPADYLAAIDGIKAESHIGTCSSAAADGRIVITQDFDSDPKWKDLKHLPLGIGYKAAWSKPIMARDGRVLGTFGTYFKESREPSSTEIQMVEILSRTAALAIERHAAEEALRESSEFNQDVIDSLPSHVAVLDSEGVITAVNRAWRNFAVQNGAEWSMSGVGVGVSYLQVCKNAEGADSEDAQAIHDGIQAVLRGDRNYFALEYPCHSPIVKRWFLLTVSPLTRGGAVISHFNITDRRLAEEGMRQTTRQLELVTNTAPVYISYSGVDGRYKFVNKAYAARFGLKPEECIGKKMEEVSGKEAHAVFSRYIDTVLSGRMVELEIEVPYETIGKRFMHCSYTPEFDPTGQVIGYVGALTDITQRRKIEEEVRRANERFRIAEQASNGFVYDLDLVSNTVTRSDGFAKVLGYEIGEVSDSGEAWLQLIDKVDYAGLKLKLDREIGKGSNLIVSEYRVRHKSGSLIWVLDECAVVRDRDGKPVRLVGSAVDITARKQAEARLNLLAEISELARTRTDPMELMYEISRAVGEHFEVKRCLFNEIDLENDVETVHRDYCRDGIGSVAGQHPISAYSKVTTADMAAGVTVSNNDSRMDPRTAADFEKTYEPAGERSYIAVPLLREGRWVASLWISDDRPREWSLSEVSLLETVAERTWTAVEKLRIDADLRESQSHLQITTEAAGVGTWRWNLKSGEVVWSSIHKRLWGFNPEEEITYERWANGIDLHDLIIVERAVDSCLAGKEDYDVEYRVRRADTGEIRWIRTSGKPEFDADGGAISMQGISIDVTERKQRELNAEFLADIGKVLAQMTEPADIMQFVGEKTADHFGAFRVTFSAVDPENRTASIIHDVNTLSLPATADVLKWDDFMSRESQLSILSGQPFVIDSVASDPRTAPFAERFEKYDTASLLAVPYSSEGRVKYLLSVDRNAEGAWTKEDIELVSELTSRVWTQLDRRLAEEKLRNSEERLRAMFESTTVGVAMLDPDGHFLQVNDAFCEITGYQRELLLTLKSGSISHPQDVAEMQSKVDELLGGRRRSFTIEKRYIRPDESAVWVQNHVSLTRDLHGEPLHLVVVSQDITSRKEAESITQRYQLLSEHARDMIWLLRPDGSIVEANKAAVDTYGYSREELLQMNVKQLRHQTTLSSFGYELKSAVSGNVHFETVHVKKDGTPFPVEVNANSAEIGGELYLMSIVRDITERKKAEMVLRESEERFAKAFNASPLVVTITSLRTGRLVEVNQTFADVTGVAREDAIGKSTDELGLWSPEERESELSTLLERGSIKNREYVFRVKGGTEEIVGLLSAEMMEIGGEPCALTVIQDVTERKRSEESLRQSEQRLQQLADAMPQVVWVADPQGHVTYYNHRVSEFHGVDQDDDGIWNWQPCVHPDDIDATAAAWRRSVERKETYSIEHRIQMMDGRYRWHLSRAVPIVDDNGVLQRWFGTATDIHDLKVAEEKMLAAERRAAEEYYEMLSRIVPLAQSLGTARELDSVYRGVLNFVRSSMPCSAFFVSFYDSASNLRIAAYAWGVEAGELDVKTLPPLELTENGGPNSQAVFQRRPVIVNRFMEHMRDRNHVVLAQDGIDPNSSMAVPMIVMDQVIGTLEVQAYQNEVFTREHVIAMEMVANLAAVAIENVRLIDTEAKARKEAEAANRMKDEFLSVLSHELRTPLNAMLGWVRMLRTGVLDKDRTSRALEVIERNTRQQGSLIEDLLDVSRIISGRMRVERDVVDLVPIVTVAAESVRPLALNKGLDLQILADLEPLYVNGDAVRLQQVITNLLQNAVKFTPAGGEVRLTLEKADRSAIITVVDTGVGIESTFLPNIFDRFSQADASTRRNFTGLGLGLTIVRTIVGLHEGEITAASDGTDKGATFTVKLPLHDEYLRSSGRELSLSDAGGAPGKLAGASILLVDDDAESMQPIQIFLETQKAIVQCAGSVNEALGKLAERDFDVLVSDIGMPSTDGYQFIELVRNSTDVRNSAIPAIALTAYASADDRERALAAGFHNHLVKPVDFELLLAAIQIILRQNS